MNLFVFDEEGVFVKEYIDNKPNLSPDYYIPLVGLESGRYKMVLWGGLNDHYIISDSLLPGKTQMDELELLLKYTSQSSITNSIPHLFYASHASEAIEVIKNQDVNEKLKLVQNSYKINVTVNGLEKTDETYAILIEDNIRSLNFQNGYLSGNAAYKYTTICKSNSTNQLNGSLSVPRLVDDKKRRLAFRLESNQQEKPLFEDDLVDLLLSLRTVGGVIDFTYMHEFDLVLTVKTTSEEEVTFTVSINGWVITQEETPL